MRAAPPPSLSEPGSLLPRGDDDPVGVIHGQTSGELAAGQRKNVQGHAVIGKRGIERAVGSVPEDEEAGKDVEAQKKAVAECMKKDCDAAMECMAEQRKKEPAYA